MGRRKGWFWFRDRTDVWGFEVSVYAPSRTSVSLTLVLGRVLLAAGRDDGDGATAFTPADAYSQDDDYPSRLIWPPDPS